VLLTNQYSANDFHRVFDIEKGDSGLPGIFFSYDLEPISVRITESRRSLTWFLVRLCGIIGGMWATAAFAFKVVDNAWTFLTGSREYVRTGVGSDSNGAMHVGMGAAVYDVDSAFTSNKNVL
jgi:hypothetical protein